MIVLLAHVIPQHTGPLYLGFGVDLGADFLAETVGWVAVLRGDLGDSSTDPVGICKQIMKYY